MKQKFSKHWVSSSQVRKQRKYRYHAPLHIRRNFLNSHLSKELRKKYERRSFPVRKGDEVLIMRGKYAKKKGKIASVDLKRSRITIENINRTKNDGTKVNVFFDASNLQIQEFNLDDKKRVKALKMGKPTSEDLKKTSQTKEMKKTLKSEEKNTKENKDVPNKSESK